MVLAQGLLGEAECDCPVEKGEPGRWAWRPLIGDPSVRPPAVVGGLVHAPGRDGHREFPAVRPDNDRLSAAFHPLGAYRGSVLEIEPTCAPGSEEGTLAPASTVWPVAAMAWSWSTASAIAVGHRVESRVVTGVTVPMGIVGETADPSIPAPLPQFGDPRNDRARDRRAALAGRAV